MLKWKFKLIPQHLWENHSKPKRKRSVRLYTRKPRIAASIVIVKQHCLRHGKPKLAIFEQFVWVIQGGDKERGRTKRTHHKDNHRWFRSTRRRMKPTGLAIVESWMAISSVQCAWLPSLILFQMRLWRKGCLVFMP